ncbi:MAG: DNA polymerase III subunit delta [Bacteroidales bacterium]|nr:DNA polymerase III subunit delta [Bacteroidales bacterium]
MLFSDIPGQQKIKQQLIGTVNDERISHAQMLLGPEGSGKLALAIAYAQYINCHNRTDDDACGYCPSCVKYNKLIHPDLHFVYPVAVTQKVDKKPTSEQFLTEWRQTLANTHYHPSLMQWYEAIGIEKKQGIINADDCNNIIHTLNYKSYESDYKVMIIWMVERLFHSAAPKLLKILEEPPDRTLFILVAENHEQIINTIISRTQIVKIPKYSDEAVAGYLQQQFGKEGNERNKMINLANGNLKEAIEMASTTGVDDFNFTTFREWMRLCYKGDYKALYNFVSKISKIGREKQKSFLNYGLKIVRHSLLNHYGKHELIRMDGEELQFLQKFSNFIHSGNAAEFADLFNEVSYHIERNGNASVLFMDASIRANKIMAMKPKQITT